MSNQAASGINIGFTGLLALIFITLKLTGFISWSWVWVLSPLWIPLSILVGIAAIVFFAMAIVWLISR